MAVESLDHVSRNNKQECWSGRLLKVAFNAAEGRKKAEARSSTRESRAPRSYPGRLRELGGRDGKPKKVGNEKVEGG